jgi:hypothetical protein
VDKGVPVAEKLGQFQVLDLNQKNKKVNHYSIILKNLTLKPYT